VALTFLIDTSVLTRMSRSPLREVLSDHFANASVSRATITDLELGYSARSTAEWDLIAASLASFSVDIAPHHLRRAGQVQRMLAARGLRGRKVPDLIVAACAEDHGLTVLHYDADFDHIASVTGQPTAWVVPAGSID
jgi:predicted nucleic acid-binding protein